ncbi:MAG: response regulator transcription factor [Hyphomicrobiaceae bacterium]|nr:response regulator transcription factor [Hyphomicrobiaceae bacterium]
MRNQKILLVDDHVVVREGVRRLLLDLPGTVVLEAGNGQDALALFRKEAIDIVLLDLNLTGIGGLELLRRMLKENAKARIIVFSMHSEPLYAARALRLGAKGYVSKSAASDELLIAIRRVGDGGHYIERELASQLAVSMYGGEDPLQQLSTREIEILRLLGEGRSMTQIAESLGVSYKTIANTCSIMKTKLGLDRTADLIRTSIELFKG